MILFATFFAFGILRFTSFIVPQVKLIYLLVMVITYAYEIWYSVMFTLFMLYLADVKYDKKAKKAI